MRPVSAPPLLAKEPIIDAYNYQVKASLTAIYPDKGEGTENAVNYCVLGLIGESGELANKWKKFYRDADRNEDPDVTLAKFKAALADELGDVIWYVSQLCNELGIGLDYLMEGNLDKLRSRRARGTLHGAGDNR